MAANIDIIKTGLTLANIINDRETPTARQGEYGLELLNDMMSDWQEDGIELGYYPQTLTADTFPIDDRYFRGVKYNLARAIAGFNGVVTPQETTRIADLTFDRLVKATHEVGDTTFKHMPTGRRETFDVNNG